MTGPGYKDGAAPLRGSRSSSRALMRRLEAMFAALPEDPESFRHLCAQVTDWGALLRHAGRHGVRGELSLHLLSNGVTLPTDVMEQIERQRAYTRLTQFPVCHTLDQVSGTLEAAGVRAVALKGPVLAERLYADPSVRASIDVDLLIAEEDVERAAAALEGIGYQTDRSALGRYLRDDHHKLHLRRPNSPLIELHFGVYVGFGTIVAAEPFLARAARYVTARGPATWVLAPEDEFIHLALHAAGHRFERLIWLYDLKRLVARHPDLDWSTVAERAGALRVVRAVSFTCEVLRRRLGLAIPHRDDLPAPRGLRWCAAQTLLATTGALPIEGRPGLVGWVALQALLCDHPASAVQMLRRRLARFTRRRAQRFFPRLVPDEGSA